MFEDRIDAGQRLAMALEGYKDRSTLVLAIPCGGVEVAHEVALHLQCEMDIIVTRKLPFPHVPEAGFGAIAEDGSLFVIPDAIGDMPKETIDKIIYQQEKEVKRRIAVLRSGRALPELEGRTVILVDDGIAMGSTMRASVMLCKKADAAKIVVAVPIAGKDIAREIKKHVDDVFILETPCQFHAVAEGYAKWHDVSDEQVIEVMRHWQDEKNQIMSY